MQTYGFYFAVLLSLFSVELPLAAAEPLTLRYSFVSNGKISGSEVDAFHPDGTVTSDYKFNDRGRGPKVTAHYLLDRKACPCELTFPVSII